MSLKVKVPVGGDQPNLNDSNDNQDINTPDVDKNDNNDTGDDDPIDDDPNVDSNKGDDDKPFTTDGLQTIQIDEDNLFVNSDGSIVDSEGSVKYTKDEFDAIRANSDVIDVSLIEKYSGIILKDEKGNPITFENNIQGIAKREAFIKEKIEKEAKQQAIQEFFEGNPVIKDIYNHYRETGTFEGFKPTVDYKTLELSKDNTEQLEAIIIEAAVARGFNPEKAQKMIEYYKNDNTLYEEAIDAKNFLADKTEKETQAKNQAQVEATKKAQQDAINYYGLYYDDKGNEVVVDNEGSLYNTIVTKRRIGEFVIPETGITIKNDDGSLKTLKPKDIFEYVALDADGKGNSQAELDEMKQMSDMSKRLQRFLFNLTAGDLSKLIPQSVASKKVKDIPRYTSGKQKSQQNVDNNKGKKIITPV